MNRKGILQNRFLLLLICFCLLIFVSLIIIYDLKYQQNLITISEKDMKGVFLEKSNKILVSLYFSEQDHLFDSAPGLWHNYILDLLKEMESNTYKIDDCYILFVNVKSIKPIELIDNSQSEMLFLAFPNDPTKSIMVRKRPASLMGITHEEVKNYNLGDFVTIANGNIVSLDNYLLVDNMNTSKNQKNGKIGALNQYD